MKAIGANEGGRGPAIYVESAADTMISTRRTCRVFVSYARVDEPYRTRLEVHLKPLVRAGLIEVWSDRNIAPGAEWESDIWQRIVSVDVFVFLVTPDFVASSYCEKEVSEALRRYEEDGVRILPVHVKTVDLVNLSYGRFQGLPLDLRPVSAWQDADEAWSRVAQGVRVAAEEVLRASDLPRPRGRPVIDKVDKTSLGQELQGYYGADKCVVDGPVGDVEWVPLNDDAQDMRFDNLVPLGTRHRMRPYLVAAPRRATFRFGIDLVAENLFHTARRHFHAGLPELAVGCARLGDMLAGQYPSAFEAQEGDDWAFLAQSLYYLPYRMHPTLLAVALTRIRNRLAINGQCSNAGRAALLLAVANLYQDAGAWATAEELYDEVLASQPAPLVQIASIRRRAVGRIFRGASQQAVERDFRRVGDYETTPDLAVALAISQGWWHLARGRPEQCLRQLERFNFDDDPPYSPHNAIEFKLTQASALIALGLTCTPQLRYVAERQKSTQLRPVFTEYVAPLLLADRLRDAVMPFVGPATRTEALEAAAGVLLAARGTGVTGRTIWVD
jgi:hypothetical protein